jgi:multiple sugar transport system permease protein
MARLTKLNAAIFLLPAVLVMLVITIYPFIYTIVLSFQKWNLGGFGGKQFVGLANYAAFFTDPDVASSLTTTAIYVFGCITLELLLGLSLAFLFEVEFKGQELIRTIIFFPMVMSEVVVGLIWRWMYNSEFGVLNAGLEALGLPAVSWLTTPGVALMAIIITDVWQWTPLVFLVCLAGLKSVPAESLEAARLDGAPWWRVQWHIALPAIKPIILAVLLLRTIDCMRFVDKIFIMTYGGPGGDTSILPFFLYLKGFKYFNMGQTAAYALIYLAMITILAQLMIRAFRTKEV